MAVLRIVERRSFNPWRFYIGYSNNGTKWYVGSRALWDEEISYTDFGDFLGAVAAALG